MPFLEFIGDAIWFIVAAIVSVVSVVLSIAGGGIVAVGTLFVTAVLGWLPILMCASDPHWDITFRSDASLIEWAAAFSLSVYLALSVGVIILAFTLEDADGVPPGLKVIGLTRATARRREFDEAMALGRDSWREFLDLTRKAPGGMFKHYWAVLETQRMRRQTAQVRAEAERQRAAADLAQAAVDLETQRARARASDRHRTRR